MVKALVILAAGAAMAAGITPPPVQAEEVSRLAGRVGEPVLLVRHEPGPGPSVLFVHGATFPSALSISYRINGQSWMDDLRSRGFDVWAFDFAGYGGSDSPPTMAADGPGVEVPGRAPDAARQIERVVLHLLTGSRRDRVSIVAHSWGTIPAGLFAGRRPELVERLVLFGPVSHRRGDAGEALISGSYLVTAEEQRQSFAAGLPDGQPPLIDPAAFSLWVDAYLATDPQSRDRTPASVRVPSGWQADFRDAWSGRLPYDPANVRAPTLIVRGEWDEIAKDEDAAWLVAALTGVLGGASDVKLPRGGHRMHLEQNREALFGAVGAFLTGPVIGTGNER
ncbi:alpha/beta fold hydrolase [Caulobacter sp. ErkDOM-E]|uniref:alpha/beta fold hydrolase n=1 Tax=Caulobacter sp. ErkDOM-E TaxID=3402778 RepID=UPI003AF49E17